jgi:hypothetical protein
VKVCRFEAFDPIRLYGQQIRFDGMWACASLLHVAEEEFLSVVQQYLQYLEQDGVFFMSFKHREDNHILDCRSFTNFTKAKMMTFIEELDMELVECRETGDIRPERCNEGWISVVLQKKE